MSEQTAIENDHGTRIICAKLYEGGLFWANTILSGLNREPYTARSPETGLDINLISRHAERAVSYHLTFAYVIAAIAVLGIIIFPFNSMISGILAAADVAIISWKTFYMDRKIAIDNFSKKKYNPSYGLGNISSTQGEAPEDAKQNVVIFGEYSPFIGAGHRVRNWNIVVDTSKPSKSLDSSSGTPEEISIEELYTGVFNEIHSKDLPNISQEFVLFADGKELGSSFLLPHRISDEPISHLDPALMNSEGHGSLYNEYRTYYTIKYFDKVRSTLLSTFVRFYKIGKELFIECSFYVLPPIDENKFNIDKIPLYDDTFMYKAGGKTALLTLVSLAFATSPFTGWIPLAAVSIMAFLPLYGTFNEKRIKTSIRKRLKKSIEKGEPHNYGIRRTFRESISRSNYKNYFSAQDIIMVRNSMEQAIVNAVAKSLDSKGIDSSLLTKDLLNFVNQGIIMYGGQLEADQISVGKGAKALHYVQEQVQNIVAPTR